MTDSAPVQPPPGPSPGPAKPPPAPPPNAVITALPPGLRDIRQVLQLQGEVTKTNTDGSVRIATDQGEIDVRMDPRQSPPQEGERVEVDIQPGRPPQTARVTPEDDAPPVRSAPPSETEAPPPPPRSVETPVEVDVPPPAAAPTSPPPQSLPQQPVELESLPPEEALALIQDPVETILSSLEQQIDSKVQIIVAEAQDQISTALNVITQPSQKPVQSVPTATSVPTAGQAELPPILSKDISPNVPENIPADTKPVPALPADPLITLTAPDTVTSPAAPRSIIPLKIQAFFKAQPQAVIAAVLKPFLSATTAPTTPGAPVPTAPITIPALFDTPEILPSFAMALPQIFHARITALQIPPAMVAGLPDLQNIPKSKSIFAVPSADLPLILKNQKAGTITATVIGQTAEKLPIISMFAPRETASDPVPEKGLFFVLHTAAPSLVPGVEITLMPQEGGMMTLAAPLPAIAPSPLSFLTAEPWPLMNEIFQALTQIMPQAAQAFVNTLPSPAHPSQMNAAALFFIAAVNGGDMTAWLGDRSTDMIRRAAGRGGLMSRLSLEGASLNRLSSEPVSQDWKAMSLPLYWDNEIHKMALYYKHDSESGKDGKTGGKQVRFIFDLKLDNMGKVQLDGLFRPARLDLIVRSEGPFSQAMQMQMRRAYINALEPTEVRGELTFQNKIEQWVTIKPERQKFGTSA